MTKTDKELFRDYLNSKMEDRDETVGATYFPEKGYEFYDFDRVMTDIANAIVNYEPEPLDELDHAIDNFSGAIADLERVKAGFLAYKAAQEAA
jgi:predicted P-loop ATPase/GTPase